jgi:hypothetical protein
MSAIFTHALRYEFLNRITLVRQSAKRERLPDVLTTAEIGSLLAELPEPCRTAVLLAATTGLRVSELLALIWSDVDFAKGEIRPCRVIVDQVIGSLKTEASGKAVPIRPLQVRSSTGAGDAPTTKTGISFSPARRKTASNPCGLTVCYARSSGPLRCVLAFRSVSPGIPSGAH